MLQILGYLGSLMMGLSLGLVGGGGSIIALPILVYLFHVNPELAITYSLFIVGSTSVFASANHIKQNNFDTSVAIKFGIASIIAVATTRIFIIPNIPEVIVKVQNTNINKPMVLLLLFSILMLIASIKMIVSKHKSAQKSTPKNHTTNLIKNGIGVGFLTGLIGAGGGFLIVPTLVNNTGLTMKKAIGTSLIIIGVNSLIGFAISIRHLPSINWFLLLTFLGIAFIGSAIGAKLSLKISNEKLKPIFGWFVLVTGIYIIVKEVFFHT